MCPTLWPPTTSTSTCKSLLCVKAFRGNVVFLDKHESVLNKMTEDGKIIESETYVGGHVKAIESEVQATDRQVYLGHY